MYLHQAFQNISTMPLHKTTKKPACHYTIEAPIQTTKKASCHYTIKPPSNPKRSHYTIEAPIQP